LDQFAERRGERTWQTPITEAGLETLRRMLRKTARKNTAVACHWIRGRDHSELLWIVGDASRFNAQGQVPTNTTGRNVLRRADENDWHTGEDIRLLAGLAALLHDLGKASVAFQSRLREGTFDRNLYRHEWVSLRLFQAFVGEDDDVGWLRRFAEEGAFSEQYWTAAGRYQRDGLDATDRYPFRKLPPLAGAVGWLVVTHHRLPVIPVYNEKGRQEWLGKRSREFEQQWRDIRPIAVAASHAYGASVPCGSRRSRARRPGGVYARSALSISGVPVRHHRGAAPRPNSRRRRAPRSGTSRWHRATSSAHGRPRAPRVHSIRTG
jgi:CRISPR-associated endonuclease/helicase Cas3